MATLCKVPSFLSLLSHKLFLSRHHHFQLQQECKLCWNNSDNPPRINLQICPCLGKKSRRARKVKSNAELCDDIREFVSTVGLPEGHVPSFKELCDHGRNDLAHIVRRRGYKVIRDLLSSTVKADIDDSNEEKKSSEGQDAVNDCADMPAGQDKKLKVIVEDMSFTSEVPINSDSYCSMNSDSEYVYGENQSIATESSSYSISEEDSLYSVKQLDEPVDRMVEDRDLLVSSCELELDAEIKNTFKHSHLSTSSDNAKQLDEKALIEQNPSIIRVPVELKLQDKESSCTVEDDSSSAPSSNVDQPMEEVSCAVKDISLSAEVSTIDDSFDSLNTKPILSDENEDFMPIKTSTSSSMEEKDMHSSEGFAKSTSLEEKVAKFMKNGDLDAVEENVYAMVDGRGTEDIDAINEQESANPIQTNRLSEGNFSHTVSGSNGDLTVNGSLPTSVQVMSPGAFNAPTGYDHLAAESLGKADHGKDSNTETRDKGNQVDINHLKFMLHQKELELSHLKDVIEKEKLALSTLQKKAEAEISKAQKLISEKDAELLAAEESLSDLVEVELQFRGDGEIVEVTGSFNGWHHQIKMDLQSSSVNIDSFGARKSKTWSSVLWLYPGVYEIKFIVDGQWKVDPDRETISKGGICNNILRVSR